MRSELFLSRSGGQSWAVLREDGVAVEVRVEDERGAGPVGSIVKARVVSVLRGIESAFLETGMTRDGFLHVSDMPREPGDANGQAIERRLRPGQELLVQVSRDSLASKGARLTCHLTFPGRYLVYAPCSEPRAVSRRIRDAGERQRLKEIVERLDADGGGFIVRTAAQGALEEVLRADAALLVEDWRAVRAVAERAAAPQLVHRDHDLLLRLLRDLPGRGTERIVVDTPEDRERALGYLQRVDPALAARVELHCGPTPLLEAHALEDDIERSLRPKVWLDSGGYLVIEPTEALVSIDVNTGKSSARGGPGDPVLRANLEAAAEIARQLRLRDLGGIIVIDFIDMDRPVDGERVLDALREALRADRARTKIVGLSDLGLVQLTRKRTRPELRAQVTRACPACAGSGRVKTPETVACEALAELGRVLPNLDDQSVTLRAHPEAARALRAALCADPRWSEPGNPEVRVEEDDALLPDRFDLLAW